MATTAIRGHASDDLRKRGTCRRQRPQEGPFASVDGDQPDVFRMVRKAPPWQNLHAQPMPLKAGTRLGAYEIVGPLGAGGMGEVYTARDGRLERTVAVKILPPHVASEPTLKERFEREAKALAALSHPHICAVYDVGHASTDQGDIDFLVMEHLEGETLAKRLVKGALPASDALRCGVEIADALDKAHRKNILHRDVKPGNIMLTASGAKLLDFGLAKIGPSAHDAQDVTGAPTVASPLTGVGRLVGTFQYMSPEQLEGQEADARTDIFAFGAVLYEMLTGRKAFEGKTQASVIGAILEREPAPVSSLRPTAPAALDQIIKTCLAKNPDNRWQSAGDVGRQLKGILEGGSQPSATAPVPAIAPPGKRGWLAPAAAVAVAVAGLVAGGTWMVTRPAPVAPATVTRFLLSPAAEAPLVNVAGFDVIISPDGARVVYLGERPQGGRALFLRELGGLEPRMIAGTEMPGDFGNANPFFSWDGSTIGFRTPGQGIMRVSITGGRAVKIADDEPGFVGAAWGPNDTVIAALLRGGTDNGLYRVSASGGTFERVTPQGKEGVLYVAPTLLPGGAAVLVEMITLQPPGSSVALVDLDTGAERVLLESGSNPTFLPSGHVAFGRGNTLMVVPFDLDTLTVRGDPIPVIDGVRHPQLVASIDYSVSRNGTLVYVPDAQTGATAAPVWVDRTGRAIGPAVSAPLNDPREVQLSPNGRRLAVAAGLAPETSLWVYDLGGRPPLPLAEGGINRSPLWSPDGNRVFFTSNLGGGTWDVYAVSSDGSSPRPQVVPTFGRTGLAAMTPMLPRTPLTWLRDGRLVFSMLKPTGTDMDLFAVPPDGSDSPDEILRSGDTESSGAVSPDGRWLAYRSTRTGRGEIWVMGVDGAAPVRVSQNGGDEPEWSRDGGELYFLEGNRMMAVAAGPGPEFVFRPATLLFDQPYFHTPTLNTGSLGRSYDVGPDGRFLMIPFLDQPGATTPPTNIVVVQNWLEEIRRLVPVN